MTAFQLFAFLVFTALAGVAYGKDIYAWLRAKLPAAVPALAPVVPGAPQEVVDDLMIVAAMRERFIADDCADGTAACSALLKIIIDHKHPHATVRT